MTAFIHRLFIAVFVAVVLMVAVAAADAQPVKQAKYGKATAPAGVAAPWWRWEVAW